jgi:hypothetical protein
MTEADLKRALVKSITKQGGVAFRMEDRYAVGRPDLYMHAVGLPPFLIEAKILHGAKLVCTDLQAEKLKDLHRPPFAFAAIIGWKDPMLYIGQREQPLSGCLYVPRPSRLESNDWPISDLLRKQVDRILLST